MLNPVIALQLVKPVLIPPTNPTGTVISANGPPAKPRATPAAVVEPKIGKNRFDPVFQN